MRGKDVQNKRMTYQIYRKKELFNVNNEQFIDANIDEYNEN